MHTISSSLEAPQDPRLRQTDGAFYATQLARVVVVAAVVLELVERRRDARPDDLGLGLIQYIVDELSLIHI